VDYSPQPPNLAAAAEKFTAAENPPKENAAGHNPAVKIIRTPPDFRPAVEFDTIKFGIKVHAYSYSRRQDGLRPQEWDWD